jgi:hypothetical protein
MGGRRVVGNYQVKNCNYILFFGSTHFGLSFWKEP